MTGVIAKYRKKFGYGFIRGEDKKEIFFSYRDIMTDGHKEAKPGDQVEYELTRDDRKRPKAVKIKVKGGETE